MSLTEENISRILSVLSHPLRRQIILYLNEHKTATFTDLANYTKVDTGKLSFHIRTLGAFLAQTETGKYKLSAKGKNAIILIKDLEDWALSAETVDDKISDMKTEYEVKPSRRISATLIDFILIQAFMIIGYYFFLISLNLIIFVIVFWAYLTLFEGYSGQSLGKLILTMKVVRLDGKKISYGQSSIRNFGKVFLLPFDLYFGLRLKDKRYWRYFEKYTQTTLINVPKK